MDIFSNLPLLFSLLTLLGAVILLVGNFLRCDLVAVLIILALTLSGVLDVSDALSGFSSHAVIIVASMFIIGEAIIHTGIARSVGSLIIRFGGGSEIRLLAMIMGAAGLVGAFMSSAATAAIFIPITLAVAEKADLNHKRLLMPLAAASLVSGMMTLVATTPNIVANNILRDLKLETLSFFSFTPFGLLTLVLAFGFMALFGQNMLAAKSEQVRRKKEPSIDDLLRYYNLVQHEYLMRIPAGSPLADCSVARAQLGARHQMYLLAVQTCRQPGRPSSRQANRLTDRLADRGADRQPLKLAGKLHNGTAVREGHPVIIPARPEVVLQAGDLLMLVGRPENAAALAEAFSLEILEMPADSPLRRAFFRVVGVAEVMLTPDSGLLDKNLRETQFQSLYNCLVLGIRRKGATLTEKLGSEPLKFGDVLLVCGSWRNISRLGKNREQYLLLTMPGDIKEYAPGRAKRPLVLAVLAGMVALMVGDFLPPVAAILSAAAVLLLFRCVPLKSIYTVIDWPTLLLIAGILPLALALQKTGAIDLASAGFLKLFAQSGPLLILAGLYLFTAVIGCFMASTAVAVLVAPMAVDIGLKMQISPQVCVMMVALACSAAFVSPLGSAVNMLVREPGGYSFTDFCKVGLPLLALSLLGALPLAWLFYL